MGKSISYNKRELEKKREQKKQEKQKRKVERKANAGDGSLENMIAFVDENGVISGTPPNPEHRQVVDLESIVVSTPPKGKRENSVLNGRVEHFNRGKGYGFVKDTDSIEKYFFHISNVTDDITEGNLVFFELEKGQRGMNAVRIILRTQTIAPVLLSDK
jgi:cold shock CspA family protein